MKSPRWLVAVAVAACGSSTPPPPELRPTLEAAPADAAHRDASDDVNAIASAAGSLAPRPRKATIPPQLRGLPLYVRDVDGLMLFDDEQAAAADQIATWARAAGLSVEDPVRTRLLLTRAKRGEQATTGKACGAPMWIGDAAARWRTELAAKGRIEARVQCSPGCSLNVTVSQGLDISLPDAGASAFYAAPFDVTRPWRTELPHALAQLVDLEATSKQPVVPGAIEPGGPADVAFDARGVVPLLGLELRDRVEHCVPLGESVGLLLELDDRGAVQHCEGEDHHTVGNLAAAPCACKELTGQVFSDAKGRRRGTTAFYGKRITTTTKRGLHVTAKLRATDVISDPSIADWAPETSFGYIPIEQCFATESDAEPIETDVTLEFDALGIATKATVVAPIGSVKKCIETALKTVRAPCPAVAKTTATGHLSITFARP